jgi:hypothetical protein
MRYSIADAAWRVSSFDADLPMVPAKVPVGIALRGERT